MTYLLFAGKDFYPSGGVRDFVAEFATLQEALAFDLVSLNRNDFTVNWAHVARVDERGLMIVARLERDSAVKACVTDHWGGEVRHVGLFDSRQAYEDWAATQTWPNPRDRVVITPGYHFSWKILEEGSPS